MKVSQDAAVSGLVTVDCGNSTIDCLRHDDGARARLPHEAAVELCGILAGARRIVAVSVVPASLAALRMVAERCGVPVACAGIELPCPLRLDYATPATLGADRWVGCLAAHREAGRAIVVDCGTATTVNLVEEDGTFRGGPIAPGLRAFELGMRHATPALPSPRLDADPPAVPRTTQDAVDAGVLHGYCGLVERLVAGVLAAARGGATVFVTGGNADRVQRLARLRGRSAPDLVHRGLRLLAAEPPCAR